MPEFNIDNLKKTWQEAPITEKYSQNDILKMLNKQSINYIKYILWIGILEFLLIILFFILMNNDTEPYFEIISDLGIQNDEKIRTSFIYLNTAFKLIGMLITAYFVTKFYKNYKNIHLEESIKDFTFKLLKFRNVVRQFILVNLSFSALYLLVLPIFIYSVFTVENIDIDKKNILKFSFIFGISAILSFLFIYIYYKLIYGNLISRLNKNIKKIEEMDTPE